MTNSPSAMDRIRRRQMFFPIAAPAGQLRVSPGTKIEASVQMLADDVFAWQVSVVPERGEPLTFLQTGRPRLSGHPISVRLTRVRTWGSATLSRVTR